MKRTSMIFFVLAITGISLFAQEFRGTIRGTVRDSSGAVVPSVKVTITNTNTNTSVRTETAPNGTYTAPFLTPGPYRVRAELQGFKTFTRGGIEVQVQDRIRVDIVLELGAVTETVEVTAEAELLESSTASVGEVVDQRKIIDLPLNGRNPYLVTRLVPGIQPADNRSFTRPFDNGGTSNMSIGGNPRRQNDVLLDGIPNTAADNTIGFIPSVEAVQEMKVQTNTFDAEFGRAAGGIVNVTVKSGTNSFHGALHEFWRNDILEANNFFNNRAGEGKPTQRFHMFGASAGGPLYIPGVYNGRDRTFIFGSWESIRQADPDSVVATVPTLLQREGDFSETFDGRGRFLRIYDPFTTLADPDNPGNFLRDPFPNNQIPRSMMDPVALNVLQMWASPNKPGLPLSAEDNYFWSGSPPDDYDAFVIRLDHNFTDNQRIFFRGSMSQRPRLGQNDIFGTVATESQFLNRISRGAALDYVNTLGPRALLNVRYGLVRYGNIAEVRPQDFKLTSLGFPESLARQVVSEHHPRFRPSGIATIGREGIRETLSDVHTLQANMTRVGSRHNLKWGTDTRVLRDNGFRARYAAGDYRFTNAFTRGPDPVRDRVAGHSVASFLLGTPSSGTAANNVATAFQNIYYGLYVQDDIRMTSNLTVNLGMRWEYETPKTERFDRMSAGFAFDADSPLQDDVPELDLKGGMLFANVGGLSRGQTNANRKNLAPRFGIAYQFHPRVVLRAGYGVFFASASNLGGGENAAPGFSVSTPMVTSLNGVTPHHRLSNPFPDGLLPPIGASQGLSTLLGQNLQFVDRNRRTPYTQQYSFGFQFELAQNLLVETLYSGNRGIALENSNLQLNQLSEEQLKLGDSLLERVPNPFFGLIETGSLSNRTTTRGQLLRPYPHFTGVTMRDPTIGSATYHSFQLKVERRFSRGFTTMVAYTNAKLIDDIGNRQNHRNIKPERSLAETINRPQRVVISGIWELPFGPGRRWTGGSNSVARKLLEGWQMDWITTFQSGAALDITSDVNNTNSFGGGQRPSSTGKAALLTGDITDRLDRYFDTDQFVDPPSFQFGNLARTLPDVRGPGLNNFDISLIKNTQLSERVRLQFRAEAFNIWNHTAFADPGTEFGTGSFGRIRAVAHRANPARQIMLAMKLLW